MPLFGCETYETMNRTESVFLVDDHGWLKTERHNPEARALVIKHVSDLSLISVSWRIGEYGLQVVD